MGVVRYTTSGGKTFTFDPDKLDERRSGIVQDFVEKINKEVGTSIRKGVENKGN